MANKVLSDAEAVEYEEFLRSRRQTEIGMTLRRMIVNACYREVDRYTLTGACDAARKLNAAGVLVSPVNVSAARRRLAGSECAVYCLVGGTGETLPSVKIAEAKRAIRQGAGGIVLVPCYSALFQGNGGYLKREIKRVRRAVKKGAFLLSLDDPALGREELERGIVASIEAKAGAVAVRGETEEVVFAVRLSAGRVSVNATSVLNSEQLRLLVKAGAEYVFTPRAERIAEELYHALDLQFAPPPQQEEQSACKEDAAP